MADWHAALMDYGSLVQTKMNPKWEQCWLTQRSIMRARPEVFKRVQNAYSRRSSDLRSSYPSKDPKEPGRFVGSKYIPNRIFRGKIVEKLRDTSKGLSISEIGKRICIDWNKRDHLEWLCEILKRLVLDELIIQKEGGYRFPD